MTDPHVEVVARPGPATREEIAAWLCVAAAVLFVFHFHLVAAVVAGLIVSMVIHALAGLLRGRFSHGAAKAIAALVVGALAAGVSTGMVFLVLGLLHGRIGDLPALYQELAVALESIKKELGGLGAGSLIPFGGDDAEHLQASLSEWLREHSAELRHAGGAAGRFVVHGLMGIVVGLLVVFRQPSASPGPFAVALATRIGRFATAFETVVRAQLEISGLNTLLTALYLFVVLPLLGHHLPLSGTLLIVTFLTGLIPVAGNLISNSIIVVLSLSVAPWLGVVSFLFLVVIHKLEYILNAKIVGGHIGASAWETLLAIIVFEAAFGIPGIVLAAVVYAWVKGELKQRGLV